MAVKDKDAAVEEEGSGTLGNVLLLAIAIAALVGLFAFSTMHRENEEGGRELPHATIQIEVDRLDPATRQKVAELERALVATGCFEVLGPASMPYLLPGEKEGDDPVVKRFESMSDAEWETAQRYLTLGEFYVPRIFRLDAKAFVIRLGATGANRRDFAPDAGAKLTATLDAYRPSFRTVRAYSRLAGVGSSADRDAINVTFGVQTAWSLMKVPGGWVGVDPLKRLSGAKAAVFSPRIRTVTTTANWVRYFYAVALKLDREPDLPTSDAAVQRATDFARRNGVNNLLSQDGVKAVIEVTTDAEGRDNAEMFYYLTANLQEALKADQDPGAYRPRVVERLKDGPAIPH